MSFEIYQKGSAPVSSVPAVTIQKRGLMSLNRAAYELIDSPAAVELLWDRDRRVIGLKPAELENPNAYPARPQGGRTKAGKGPFMVAGTMFTRFIKLDTSVATRWVPTLEDGILCIDLNGRSQVARGPRSRKVLDVEGDQVVGTEKDSGGTAAMEVAIPAGCTRLLPRYGSRRAFHGQWNRREPVLPTGSLLALKHRTRCKVHRAPLDHFATDTVRSGFHV